MAFTYFAYGSNMLSSRLLARCPSAIKISNATAEGYNLAYSKVSKDGSGKAGLIPTPGAVCRGVLFQISDEDLTNLDKAEGRGYGYDRESAFSVVGDDLKRRMATTYLPTHIDNKLQPYDWYLALVIAGAEENALPSDYIESLKSVPFDIDATIDRKGRKVAIRALKNTGISDYKEILKLNKH